jgi:hypothetical protein
MRLYHFTFVAHLFPILGFRCIAEGIRPAEDDADPITSGLPVVWLTSRPSLMPTPADLDWANSPGCPWPRESIAGLLREGPIADRTAILAVDLAPNGKRLRHITAFCHPKILELMAPSARADWWVYSGTISAERIEGFEWTDAPSVNEAEAKLKTAIEAAFTPDAASLRENRQLPLRSGVLLRCTKLTDRFEAHRLRNLNLIPSSMEYPPAIKRKIET